VLLIAICDHTCDSGSRTLDPGPISKILDLGSKILDPRSWILDRGSGILNLGSRSLDPATWLAMLSPISDLFSSAIRIASDYSLTKYVLKPSILTKYMSGISRRQILDTLKQIEALCSLGGSAPDPPQ
jgi:hypothetical protein